MNDFINSLGTLGGQLHNLGGNLENKFKVTTGLLFLLQGNKPVLRIRIRIRIRILYQQKDPVNQISLLYKIV